MGEQVSSRSITLGQNAVEVLPPDTAEPVELADGFTLTVNGMEIKGRPPFNRWDKVGRQLCATEKGIQFGLGDYLNALEAEFGDDYYQIVDYSSGWSQKTCEVYRWLAARIRRERRRMDRLGIRHHLMVAAMSPEKQKEWLDKAAADTEEASWTVARMRKALEEGEDAPVTAWWVLVPAESAEDQLALQTRIETEIGRICKAVERRGKKKEVEQPAPDQATEVTQ